MDAKKTLEAIVPKVRESVLQAIKTEQDRIRGKYLFMDEMLEHVVELAKSGKRLRGAFTYFSYLMHGGTDKKEIMRITAVPELIQLFLLIHDDIIDEDDLRRGVTTMHKAYRDFHRIVFKKRDSYHFGESIAICAGDIVSHLAFKTLAQSKFNPENLVKAAAAVHGHVIEVGYGEALDSFSEVMNNVKEDFILKMLALKTSKYTYEAPLHLGAILAGASDKDLQALTKYSLPGGTAFQIQDDILGMFGDEEKTGKPAYSDLAEGKQTILILRTMEKASPKGKALVVKSLGNPAVGNRRLEQVRQVIKDCGALDYAKEMAKKLVKVAKRNLIKYSSGKGEGREFLLGVADYMIDREF
ncbi:MAG TPA: polyprenyl synthetase family protein [Candidatus Dojkabacteria bacterium]|nr:polyprenyl synthetase family protein [Candidatus Dojkabacteria bacterium]